jgi:hypothetical protein
MFILDFSVEISKISLLLPFSLLLHNIEWPKKSYPKTFFCINGNVQIQTCQLICGTVSQNCELGIIGHGGSHSEQFL